jgi:hypothetical protein
LCGVFKTEKEEYMKKILLVFAIATQFAADAMVQDPIMLEQLTIDTAPRRQNRKLFSPGEDRQIVDWVNEHGTENWSALVKMMPGRTAHTIGERWRNRLAPHIRKDPWTLEEDQMLIAKMEELGPRWAQIAQFFPGRPQSQIRNRWEIIPILLVANNAAESYANNFPPVAVSIFPVAAAQSTIKAARYRQEKRFFTPNEDRQIIDWANEHGTGNWVELAKIMSRRTPKAIRERWIRYLAPEVRKGPWTTEEDRILLVKEKELGLNWAKIAHFLPGRTPPQIRNRWPIWPTKRIPIPAPAAEPMRFPPIDPDFMLDRERSRIFQPLF